MKDLVVDEMGPGRSMSVGGRVVANFGSDSFLGLDQDPRVRDAIERGVRDWGTHNGSSRAFSSVRANAEAEARLARWLGTEAALIYPSVTLANVGAIPALMGRNDVLIVDAHAHNSIQEGAKIAGANGAKVSTFANCDPEALDRAFREAGPNRAAMVAIDGVFSMSGTVAPLAELNEVALEHGAILYVDDAHGTGTLGERGRGTVLEALGDYDNTIVVGSLSKAFSCFGGFVGCSEEVKHLLKMRSSTFIFGGPVPPPYLEAVLAALEIIDSDEYESLYARLDANVRRLAGGMAARAWRCWAGRSRSSRSSSATRPTRSTPAGSSSTGAITSSRSSSRPSLTTRECSASRPTRTTPTTQIDGLLAALDSLRGVVPMPGPDALRRLAA